MQRLKRDPLAERSTARIYFVLVVTKDKVRCFSLLNETLSEICLKRVHDLIAGPITDIPMTDIISSVQFTPRYKREIVVSLLSNCCKNPGISGSVAVTVSTADWTRWRLPTWIITRCYTDIQFVKGFEWIHELCRKIDE